MPIQSNNVDILMLHCFCTLTFMYRAITLNPTNAVYYCNRAAAYSRLEKHDEAIMDCKEAIRLDPTYGKAYGRLGIAYSNLNRFGDARIAYSKALELDPSNAMYEANLKLAEEKIYSGIYQHNVSGNILNFFVL